MRPSAINTGDIDLLLTDLRRELPRGIRSRDLIEEIRDGLEDAAEGYRSAGLSPAAAEKRAIDDFGDVRSVAQLCRAEVGAGITIRSAILVAIAYPVILGCWDVFFHVFGSGVRTTDGHTAGNAFTLIGVLTAVGAIATALLISRKSRQSDTGERSRSRRILALGFAAMTALSVGTTYLFAALTHGRPDAAPAEVVARTVVQQFSLAVSVVMLVAAAGAARHALSSTRT